MAINQVFDYLNRRDIAVVGDLHQFYPATLVQRGTPIGFLQQNGTLIPLESSLKIIMKTSMSVALVQEHQDTMLGIWPDLFYQIQQLADEQGCHAVLSCENGTEEYAIQKDDTIIAIVDHNGQVYSDDKQVQQSLTKALEKQVDTQHLRIAYQRGLQKSEIKFLADLVVQQKIVIDDPLLLDTAKQITAQEYDELGNMIQPELTDEQVSQAQQFLADESKLYQLKADSDQQDECDRLEKEMESKYGTSNFDVFNEKNCGGRYRRHEVRFTDAQVEKLMVEAKKAGFYDAKSILGQRIEKAVSSHAVQKPVKSDSLKTRVAQKKDVR